MDFLTIDSRDGGSDQSLASEADVATFHGGERRFCLKTWDRIVQHQCGFLGCRVGEASNAGPAITRQGRRFERSTQIGVSSDEEFLVRPNRGRNVVARRCVDDEETPPCSSQVSGVVGGQSPPCAAVSVGRIGTGSV